MQKVWFVTGCSSGFGRALAEEVLSSGASAVITARTEASIEDLARKFPDRAMAVPLDVTKGEQISKALSAAMDRFGRVDVLVNNAGFGIIGAIEDADSAEIHRIFETNFFGLAEMTRAVLPIMRRQGSGHILNISSVGGFVSMPGLGFYNATKFAVEGFSEALVEEVRPFGIKVILVEPGPFRTNFVNRSAGREKTQPYNEVVDRTRSFMESIDRKQSGNPVLAAKAMIAVVEAKNPPFRFPLGKATVERMRAKIAQMEKELSAGEKVAAETDFPS